VQQRLLGIAEAAGGQPAVLRLECGSRSQAAGGIVKERDADAEAWIFISLGLLSTIDRRLGTVGDHDFEGVFASRRRWMVGETAPEK
jgi:hypothetical protein